MKINKLLAILFLLVPALVQAQDQTQSPGFIETYKLEIVLGLTVVVCVLALLVLLVALYTIHTLISLKSQQESPEQAVEPESMWSRLWVSANSFVPVEQEEELLTDHEYDGIKELDNNLPPWWLWGFYATILFSVVYLMAFHVFQWAPLQDEEYEIAMKEAAADVEVFLASQGVMVDETNVEVLLDDTEIAQGKRMFVANCIACHGNVGQGGIGPNLTDQHWIYGGDIKDIFKIVKYGTNNGMTAWQKKFDPKQMQQIASFVYSLEGTNPPDAKDPQGELYERDALESPASDSTSQVSDEQVSLLK